MAQTSAESFQGAILVPERHFIQTNLVDLARRHLARHPREKIVKLFLATTKEAATEALTISGALGERQYVTFAIRYLRPDWASWGMAEAIRIGPDAVLRVRYPDERLARIILHDNDPLLIGDDSEVIHIFVPPPHLEAPKGSPVFFVRTAEPLSEATCRRIVAELKSRTGLLDGSVRIRNDRWFITSPEMPVRYQFWEWQQIPGPVEFIEGRTALCGWDSGGGIRTPQIIYPTRKPKYCDTR